MPTAIMSLYVHFPPLLKIFFIFSQTARHSYACLGNPRLPYLVGEVVIVSLV